RRRRRRGGRGRRSGERMETPNVAGIDVAVAPKGKPATIATAPATAAVAVAAEAKPAKKAGFFHRVARLFKRS
ncbi:MAG: ATP-dependent RNA helicase RhlB, partial [Rudaea sp.]|nr:ATP-dependent RNA helicase RhlB [Rudaea sp.]